MMSYIILEQIKTFMLTHADAAADYANETVRKFLLEIISTDCKFRDIS